MDALHGAHAGSGAVPLGPMPDDEARAVALLKELIQLDTSNPPGNELPAAELCAERLVEAGLDPVVHEAAPGRANVVARLRGAGTRPPLLLTAHLDVVPADPAGWTHPPFAAEEHDGWIWGRGAIDMKHHAALSVTALGILRRSGVRLARDVIFAGVADEEAGCRHGSRFLVEEHPDLVRAEWALGEIGGFTLHLGGRRYYPIQVAEKGYVWLRLRTRGTAGHGSIPRDDNAPVRLAEAVARLGRTPLPVHITPPTARFVERVGRAQPLALRAALAALLVPPLTRGVLRRIPDRAVARGFAALLANTASPTMLDAGVKVNVIPAEASAMVDGRTLPGQSTADFLREVRAVVGDGVELEVIADSPGSQVAPEGELWDALCAAIREQDPESLPVPYPVPGFTDGTAFRKLGTRWYGFSPVRMPEASPAFSELYHGNDERIPVEGFRWGLRTLVSAVARFCR